MTATWTELALYAFALAVLVAFGCWFGLTKTKWGKLISVVIYDREASLAMGINVKMVYLVVFVIGTMLGALGGAYVAPVLLRGERYIAKEFTDIIRQGQQAGQAVAGFHGEAPRFGDLAIDGANTRISKES